MRFTRPLTLVTILAAVCLSITAHAASARDILRETGVDGGFIVHLGCGGGKLTVALRVDERYTVHGLDADAERVETARRRISRRGLYGPVSIEQLDGDTLPYADNLINLVVVSDAGSVPMGEIMRVLVPEGVAYIKADGGWGKVVKPRPDDIDDWSHFLHDAGNNPVAADTVVGPPTALQWVAPPLFLRSHETPSGIEEIGRASCRERV